MVGTTVAAIAAETGVEEEATGRGEAGTAATAVEAATGEAGEGDIPLGEVQQLQRHREDPMHRMPKARVQVPRQRHLQRGIQVL